jgi:antiviral helicase SKI2
VRKPSERSDDNLQALFTAGCFLITFASPLLLPPSPHRQCIVMLGSNPVMIFLSATTDNGVGFCDWVAGVTSRDVYFIETRKRVVPLKHQLYVGGERVTIKMGEGGFEVKGWEKAKMLVGKKAGKRAASAPRGGRPAWQDGGGKTQWQR